MHIIDFKLIRDGGTIEIKTNIGLYYIDGRMGTKTRGQIYFGYPKLDNSNLLSSPRIVVKEIVQALENYHDDLYQKLITETIKVLKRDLFEKK